MQLRPWREPPGYLKAHPVYKFWMNDTGMDENVEGVNDLWLQGKELVLIEKRRKKKRKKENKVGKVDRLKGLFDEDDESENYFSGFWWDRGNGVQSLNQTYTLCKFPLDESESVLAGLRDVRDRSVNMRVEDASKFCVELDEVVNEIKANARVREINKAVSYTHLRAHET